MSVPTTAGARLPFFLPAALSLLAGLYAATRLVLDEATTDRVAGVHGILMVLGFLGTLISLERSVALRAAWAYAAPALLGAGGLALVAPVPRLVAQVLLVAGCALATAVLVALWRRAHDDTTITQVLAASLALGAAVLWLRLDVADLLPWLVGFVVLTVCAERVELARLTLPPTAGLWLLAFATAGYAWLGVAGLGWLIGGPPVSPERYDLLVHSCFLGFGMSMVMAHAPVILPAVLRVALPYRPVLWIPLVLLHIGLLVRLVAGLADGHTTPWRVGAFVTIAALLALPASAIACVLTGRRAARIHPKASEPAQVSP
ncbi:hypothetical protein [Nostocoides jenkinsii]|uniref:Uncharacterized protein n=1 Tax=Nostocoides jenkinsii Ben 74 TaxID=1193518 RepID=A0A077MFH4_9MICO|nr:hypothetical protein [Tetrasphaera jenkinsii]CCI53893.1 conserved membrane hypothetical protein [Tetrasphaera jenkinsii Ben 74]